MIAAHCPAIPNQAATFRAKALRIVKTAPEGAVFGVCLCDLPWRWGRIWRVRPTFSCYQLEFCSVQPCVWRGGREVPPQVGGLCARSMPSNVFSCPVLSNFASPLWALFFGWVQYCRDLRPRFVGQKKDEKNFACATRGLGRFVSNFLKIMILWGILVCAVVNSGKIYGLFPKLRQTCGLPCRGAAAIWGMPCAQRRMTEISRP